MERTHSPAGRRGRARLCRGRARAALGFGLLCFACLQAGLAVAIERWLPDLRDPYYACKAARLRARALAPGRPLTVVMLGSSRTTFGLKAGELEGPLSRACGRPVVAFNFGLTGAGPLLELLTLKRLLAEGVRPDFLLVEVLPALFDGEQPHELCWLAPDRLWRNEGAVLGQYGASAAELRRAWWASVLLPWYAHRFALVSRVVPALLPTELRQDWFRAIDDSGWVDPPYTSATPEVRQRALERDRREYAGTLARYHLGSRNRAALDDLLGLCEHEGIPAALVWMPEGKTFRGWYPPAARAQVRALLADMQARHAVSVIDAQEWAAEEDFGDAHHLLPRGASHFTERLGRELVPLLLGTADRGAPPAHRCPGGMSR